MTTMNALSLSTSPENEAPVQELDESPISAAQEIETMLETELFPWHHEDLKYRSIVYTI